MIQNGKIGLITFFGHNYGSNLQCFATKSFIEHLGFKCDLLQPFYAKSSLIKKVQKLFIIITHPSHLKVLYKTKKNRCNLSNESMKLMDSFVTENLKPKKIEYSNLCNSTQYAYFITGSDQVWNIFDNVGSIPFLPFAPREKRIALAVSFGISSIPERDKEKISLLLNGFDYISVREESGIEIVKKYSNAKVCRIADPTFIYGPDEWRNFAKNGKIFPQKYILVHFIDEPCQIAIESIKWMSKQLNLDFVVFGYKHDVLKNIEQCAFVDGNPWDYISIIDKADYIFTDSFHSVLFSINFNRNFFVFHRQYSNSNQSSRIKDLLKRFNLEYRLIEKVEFLKNCYCKKIPYQLQNIIKKERNSVRDFIQDSIQGKIPQCFFIRNDNE